MGNEVTQQSTLTYLDAYCERAGDPGFWGEPINALTNLSFIVFAVLALRQLNRLNGSKARDIWALVIAMFAIGIGSGLWHTHARPWSVIADIIPIYIFINIALFSLSIRVLHFRWWHAALVWGGFMGLTFAFEVYAPRDLLNGSVMYLPTYITLGFMIAMLSWQRHYKAWRDLTAVLLVFTVSLFFRTIDMEVCDDFPLGTHFLWHTLNGYVLYGIVKLLIDSKQAKV